MKENKVYYVIRHALSGMFIMIGINFLISLSVSSQYGTFIIAPKELVDQVGILQAAKMFALYSALTGGVFGGLMVLYQNENRSLMKSTLIYFVITSAVNIYSAYQMYWMERSAVGILQYLSIFVVIFFIIWFINWYVAYQKMKKLNKVVNKANNE